jgi:hypothetical protein
MWISNMDIQHGCWMWILAMKIRNEDATMEMIIRLKPTSLSSNLRSCRSNACLVQERVHISSSHLAMNYD